MKSMTKIAMTVAAAIVLLCPAKTLSCGPFFDEAVFTYKYHPDFPLKFFAAGKLGVLQPSYARSYLFSAYRLLNGKPLTFGQQTTIVKLWEDRMNSAYDYNDAAVTQWLDARNKIAGFKKIDRISTDRSISSSGDDSYSSYLNCPDDAFTTALSTLRQKITKYGAESEKVKSWARAQDQVFCHCSGPDYHYETKKYDPEPSFPEEAPSNADPLTKAERNYQIAAAHFYAQQFDLAVNEFDAIAKDQASPYHEIAPYLAARCLVRKGTLAKSIDLNDLQNAATRLSAIAGDAKSSSELRRSAHQVLSFVEYRLHPEASLQKLAKNLMITESPQDFRQDVIDYLFLLDKYLGSSADEAPAPVKLSAIPKDAQTDLTEWIAIVQSDQPADGQIALKKWQATKAPLWLVPAIMHAKAADSASNELTSSALNLPSSSPAYPTARYHAVRLLIEAHKLGEARKELTKVLNEKDLPPSALNLFLDEQSQLATSLAEYWQDVVRTSSGSMSDPSGSEIPDELDKVEKSNTFYTGPFAFSPKAANVLNQYVSLNALRSAPWTTWPAPLKRDYLQALWTRAVLLRDDKAIAQLTPLLAAQQPLISKPLNEYKATTNPDQRLFLSLYILVNNPAMRPYITAGVQRSTPFNQIDDFKDNWWCANESPSRDQDITPAKVTKSKPTFLSADQLAEAQTEQQRLFKIGPGPTFLLTELIAYANKPGAKDKRLPEALYRAIRSPKFGCTDKSTTGLSKTAFGILHKRYPNDPWTIKTKYWY